MAGKYDKNYFEHLCDYEHGWRFLFTFSVGFLGISLVWLVSIDKGSPGYVVTVMNVFGLSVLALLSGSLLAKCR